MRLFLSLLLMAANAKASACPCSLDETGTLSCDKDSIVTLPEDLKLDTCGISPDDVSALSLFHQPRLTNLEKGAFNGLHALRAIDIEYSGLQMVGAGSFDGLNNVNIMNIRHNNLSVIADGSFDDLLHLKILNLERNNNLKGVVTKAWHFCDKIDRDDLDIRVDDQVISKWLEPSLTTTDYCNVLAQEAGYGGCVVEGNTMDCRGQEHRFSVAACKLLNPTVHPNVNAILFNFPVDENDQDVDDFYEGASNAFFKAFNSPANSNYTKTIAKLPVYAPLFDLNTLTATTGNLTKVVDIKADTTFFSEPMTLDYHLKVNSRIAIIKHPVTMRMSRKDFVNYTNAAPWAMKEEIINTTGGILMRSRTFGLLEILDEFQPSVHKFQESACQPARLDIILDDIDVTSWFDPTALALQYVCARTLVSTGSNMRLAEAMTNFNLGFAHGESIADNPRAQKAVQKFLTLKDAFDFPDIHNVPGYNLEILQVMAGIMQDSLSNYREDERQMEDSIEAAMGRMEIVQAQYDIVKIQQKMYFDKEMAQLEEIWADSDGKWDFDFSHREGINQAMQDAIDAMMNETFTMKDDELKLLLKAAEDSVNHFMDAVEKFKDNVNMYVEKTKASMELQTEFYTLVGENTLKMEHEQENFEDAIEEWKEEEKAKAARAIIGAIFNIFTAFATGEFDPGAILDAMEGIQDIIAALEELGNVLKACRDIIDILNDIDITDIEEMSNNMSTYYKDAINNAKGLAKVGPKFDEIDNLAETRIDAVDAMTDNGIASDTASMKFAMKQVSSSGNRLLEESSKFVDAVLKLAVFNNELKMAEQDLIRATEEVFRIEEAIDAFEKEKEDFWTNREKDREEYENEINQMRDEYEEMTAERREQYKKTITELFSKYQKNFDEGLAAYQVSIALIIENIHNKWIGLKNASMGQRSLVLILFMDYCDAKFYHSFQVCDQTLSPAMSDSFDVLLKKLTEIQLDSITDHPDGAPTDFKNVRMTVEDSSKLMALKSNREMQVNFAEYDISDSFSLFARTRLTSIDLRLYDAEGEFIPSPGSLAGQTFLFFITYPLVFNDRTVSKEDVLFLGQKVICSSGYYTTDEGDAIQTTSCTIDEEFRSQSYQPTPDGTFTIKLMEPATVNLDRLARIDLILGGSRIPVDNEEQ